MKQQSADKLGTLLGFIGGTTFILSGILWPAEFSNIALWLESTGDAEEKMKSGPQNPSLKGEGIAAEMDRAYRSLPIQTRFRTPADSAGVMQARVLTPAYSVCVRTQLKGNRECNVNHHH